MKHNSVHSDLRICISGEPKSELQKPGPRPVSNVQKVEETGNVLSSTESQGFRKTMDFGPLSTEPGAVSSGKCAPEPERHFVPESPAERQEQKDSRKILP